MARRIGGIAASVASQLLSLAAGVAANAAAIAGLGTPLRTDVTQSLTSAAIARVLQSLGVSYVLGAAGYINFFRVLIFQWGVASGSGGSGTWTYPTTFPTGVFVVFGTAFNAPAGVGIATPTQNRSSTTYNATVASNGVNFNGYVQFLAIGY